MASPADVDDYIDSIPTEHRALFDRIHRLIMASCPDVAVRLSYQIPTYTAGRRRLYVGAWKHGVSIYGWGPGRDAGFTDRHSELRTGKGTIRLSPATAAGISDDELGGLISAALEA
jgi:uncharacterized protein YdhG (YjbR/CyaY superfamily)